MEFSRLLERLDEKLRGIAYRITKNKADQNDLMQEMRIYLWEKREEFKDKTESYILRACYFQATHCYNRGKSIDSKPRKNVIITSLENMRASGSSGQACLTLNGSSIVGEARSILVAEEIKELIKDRLNPKLRKTFDLLMEEYSLPEIAENLNLTYEAVRLRVKKIRKLARVYLEENLVFW
ncbi:MAG: sigma-70 family RNA polymerase sigma factor [Candidatus Aerophobetes bacterium]|nr:sigma-70 family RNA polymerase sigma factor [Candidatus Aerophobetes bacterium]